MRESRTYGSVRGARSNTRPYRDTDSFQLDKLAADLAMLKAQGPIIVPQSSYRVVDKAYDDPAVRGEHYAKVNGGEVNLDQLMRDVRKFAGA